MNWYVFNQKKINLQCFQQQEIIKLKRTHLFDVPVSCKISNKIETITNEKDTLSSSQPIMFPELDFGASTGPISHSI